MGDEAKKQVLTRLSPAGVKNLNEAAANFCDGNKNSTVELALYHLQHPCDAWARRVLLADTLTARESALEAWARVVASAARLVAVRVKPYEWAFLASALKAVSFYGDEPMPGPRLGNLCWDFGEKNPSMTMLLVDSPNVAMEKRRLKALCEKLSEFTSPMAWAVLLAVRHYWHSGGPEGHDD